MTAEEHYKAGEQALQNGDAQAAQAHFLAAKVALKAQEVLQPHELERWHASPE